MAHAYSYFADSEKVFSWFKPICDQFGYIPEPKDWNLVIERYEALSLEDRYRWVIKEEKHLAKLGWNPPRERIL